MFNDRRYSLARYSVNRGEMEVPIAAAFSASLGMVAGGAVTLPAQERFAESVHGSAVGTVTVGALLPADGDLFAQVRMSANTALAASFAEVLRAVPWGCKDAPAVLDAQEALKAAAQGGKDVPAPLALAESLFSQADGSKDVPGGLALSEVLTALTEGTSQTTETASFQLTIPPGGELRIDSALFLVLLDGENALHTQSGDWINVSRSLLRLTVESASGGQLEGQLIYTERFL